MPIGAPFAEKMFLGRFMIMWCFEGAPIFWKGTSCINVHARYTNVISDLSCHCRQPVPCSIPIIRRPHLDFFHITSFHLLFRYFFPLLLCDFPQFLLLIEKFPSFFAQPQNSTSNKCKIRNMKSGFFSHFRFVCDLTTTPGLLAGEFCVILFSFVICWDLPFVR